MLTALKIKNLALIESLELTFDSGFTVLTGQTGSGKSIFLQALDMGLGAGDSETVLRRIRSGAEMCLIELTFSIDLEIKKWLDFHSIEIEDELFVSRNWRLKDKRLKSQTRINGVIVNRQQLLSLRNLLIDFTLQGESYQLINSSKQIDIVDRLGGIKLFNQKKKVKESWNNWKNKSNNLEQFLAKTRDLKEKENDIKNFLDDLNKFNIENPLEDKELKQEQDRLVNGVRISEGLHTLFTRLQDGTDDVPSVLENLSACLNELQSMVNCDSSLLNIKDTCFSLLSNTQDLIQQIECYSSSLESEPYRLEELQFRLDTINRLKKRYNLNLFDLIKRKTEYQEILATVEIDNTLQMLENEEQSARLIRDENNNILSDIRKSIALKFEKKLSQSLVPLGLTNVKFQVLFNKENLTDTGFDNVQFLFSANPGHPLAPLSEVASGGEKSRFLLAMKSILADIEPIGCLLFDEVDSGVSGSITASIAKVLKNLSLNNQVLCVTHHPLVAAAADHHLSISKEVINGITSSKVTYLEDFSDRQKELAFLAGGEKGKANSFVASLLDEHVA